MMLGDRVEAALKTVGITKERVEAVVGPDCGCEERRELLNSLGLWAGRVLAGKTKGAREYLDRMMSGFNPFKE
jgi:hypothetical protein